MSEKDLENDGIIPPNVAGGDKDKVSFESYKKLLDQRKADQLKMKETDERLKAFESEKNSLHEQELLKEKKYEEIIQLKEDARRKAEEALEQSNNTSFELKKELIDGHKLQSVVDVLPGKLKNPAYYNFIDVDSIVIDPETNTIDPNSVAEVANAFLKNHYELIDVKSSKKLPHDAGGTHGTLTHAEWLKLPIKEKRTRLKEVVK